MKTNLKGCISKIKVLKYDTQILIRFTLTDGETKVNCIVKNKNLADQIMSFPDNQISIMGYGYFNNRKQFVLTKMFVQNSEWRIRA